MKILVISHYYLPEIGAPQRRWSALVRRWQGAGHQVTVCCPGPHYPDAAATAEMREGTTFGFSVETGEFGERIVRVPYILHGYSGWTRLLDQIIVSLGSVGAMSSIKARGESFDVVIATVPGIPTMFAGLALQKLLRTPLVLEMRDAWPDVITSVRRKNPVMEVFSQRVFGPVMTSMQRRADLVVTATESFARVLSGRGVKRAEVVSNGTTHREDLASITPLPLREGQPLRVLYMGTVGRSQGLDTVLRALVKLRTVDPGCAVELRIVGEGSGKQRLVDYAKAHDVPVEFLSLQQRDAVAAQYEWADVTLVSLKDTPAFEWTVPSKLFEVLSVPRFVVGLLSGEAAEILERSGAGVCVRPGDARGLAQVLSELAANRSRLADGERGREFVLRHFNYDELAVRYLEVLSSVVKKAVL